MEKILSQHQYDFIETEDGSPSLRWKGSANLESMHHRGGAYSETQLIYGEPLRRVLELGGTTVLSLGLGLGYNEVLTACESLLRSLPSLRIHSYEADPFLIENFLTFISTGREESDLDMAYSKMMDRFPVEKLKLQQQLQTWRQNGHWVVHGPLQENTGFSFKSNVIFYDAFSSKTSPHLWAEEFLVQFLTNAAADQAVFSTYACTGALKRALRRTGFDLILRPGFHGKRQSTLGVRGYKMES